MEKSHLILLIGAANILIGIIFLIQRKSKISILPILIGASLGYIVLFGPLSESKKKIDSFKRIECGEIELIRLMPSRSSKRGNENLSETIEIRAARDLEAGCEAIRNATEKESTNSIKRPYLKARVEVHFRNRKPLIFGAERYGYNTEIIVGSNGETGWIYSQLDAREFGTFFDNAIESNNRK